MEIRKGTLKDLEAIAAVEAACFPAAERLRQRSLPGGCSSTAIIFGCCGREKGCWPLWTAFAPTGRT